MFSTVYAFTYQIVVIQAVTTSQGLGNLVTVTLTNAIMSLFATGIVSYILVIQKVTQYDGSFSYFRAIELDRLPNLCTNGVTVRVIVVSF